jgi:hypothetical protein
MKGTQKLRRNAAACNSLKAKPKEWWRRGELNPFGVLIPRNLLILRFNQICPNIRKSLKSSSPLYSRYTDTQVSSSMLNDGGLWQATDASE